MLDSIGIKVLQLYLVVVQQSLKELMGGGGKSSLMEVSEGHDIAIGRQRRVLITGQPPLLGGGPCAEKTTTDESLQALEGDIRMAPRLHWKIGVGGCEFDDG